MNFKLFPIFLKVLGLFECRQGDLYMIDNRKFVRFAHSNFGGGFTPDSNPKGVRIWLIYLKSCTAEFETNC